jgi:UDP:flavonoid glycosyltransferase YjiC (YdhE family)
MRVLFSSTSGYGHILPMLPLAHAVRDAGHDVVWATGADACRFVDDAGLPAAPSGPTGAELVRLTGGLRQRAGLLEPQHRAAFMFPHMFGGALAPAMAADLLPLAEAWKPDLLVHENGELASPLVGAVLGVPSLTHAFGGAVPPAYVAEAGERLAGLWAEHGLAVPPYAGCFTSLYLDICPTSVQTVGTDHIAVSQPLRPVTESGAVTGPLPAYLEPDDRPLVYVTWGTVQNDTARLAQSIGSLVRLPVRVLVAVGPAGNPDALGDQPANVHVERWVDQPLVLDHCSVVVSHAGSGTFLGALARGLPQLCLPQAADQFRNAEGGVRTGAALALSPVQATAPVVAEAVSRLLAEPDFRRSAEGVAAEIRAMPSPSDVVDVLLRTARKPTTAGP